MWLRPMRLKLGASVAKDPDPGENLTSLGFPTSLLSAPCTSGMEEDAAAFEVPAIGSFVPALECGEETPGQRRETPL